MGILSRTQAIEIAIESIKIREDIPPQTKNETIRKIRAISENDWYRKWSKDSIIEALMAYKKKTGRAPTVSSLTERGMPKSLTIRNAFDMSASSFLKQLFPENRDLKHRSRPNNNPFGFKNQDEWLACFTEQFTKHNKEGMSSRKYDVVRDKGTPTWGTIARHCNIVTWTELLNLTGMRCVKSNVKLVKKIYVDTTTSPSMKKLEMLNQQKQKLNDELYEMLTNIK